MKARLGWLLVAFAAILGSVFAQRPFRVYRSMEPYDNVTLPPDYQDKAEWVFGRLMYPQHPNAKFTNFARWRGGSVDWREGATSWTQDYPRADRLFSAALRRLTRIHARSVEQPVNLDYPEDVYNWPFLFAGEMGDWQLTQAQASTLRDYLLRGGFLLLDDFWGSEEWARFDESMKLVFPDRDIVDIEDNDTIFQTVYDLSERYRIPGQWGLRSGKMYRDDGETPYWKGIYDDKHRLMVGMYFNSDVGDSWEWADDPRYPEKYSALGIRLGVNFVIYSMTH